jgi:hypothetical protein
MTSALDGGEWWASRPGRALPPGKGPTVPIVQEAGWASGPVWTQRLEGKSLASAEDRTWIVLSVTWHPLVLMYDNFVLKYQSEAWVLDFRSTDRRRVPVGAGVAQCSIWLQTGRQGFDPRQRIFPLASVFRQALVAPSLLSNGYGGPLPGVKRGRRVTLTTHRQLVSRSRMSRSYNLFPFASMVCSGAVKVSVWTSSLFITANKNTTYTSEWCYQKKNKGKTDDDHSPHLVPRSWMSRSYTASPSKRRRGV